MDNLLIILRDDILPLFEQPLVATVPLMLLMIWFGYLKTLPPVPQPFSWARGEWVLCLVPWSVGIAYLVLDPGSRSTEQGFLFAVVGGFILTPRLLIRAEKLYQKWLISGTTLFVILAFELVFLYAG